jgi:5-dehydro-2-deoxygluconokinase
MNERKFDLICLGRLAVDLYAQQPGARLEDASSLAKYLGGSSANTAFGAARLGLRTAMLSRVGDDHMGRFLLETLAREGCDVGNVGIDPQRLTALVLLGIKDRDTFPLIFYRENCADMAISTADIDEAFIASSRALAITGTHFSTPGVHAASSRALDCAHRHGVRTILDIDYRPVLWGLTGRADGETRFIANDGVTTHLQSLLSRFDLVVGTEEEFLIAGGGRDLLAALRAVRAVTAATLVVKRGALGCSVIEQNIPARIDELPIYRGCSVEVLNVLGAGDAFMAGFLYGWLRDKPLERCSAYANACGAIVVSRHACAPAMPSRVELDYFLANARRLQRPDRDEELAHLHRVSVARPQWDDLHVFAFDQRALFFELSGESGAGESRLSRLNRLLIDAVAKTESDHALQRKIGVLIDERLGEDALHAATGRGWWVGRALETPGPALQGFSHHRSIGSQLQMWPAEQVAQWLVPLDPDPDTPPKWEFEIPLRTLYDAVKQSGHELLLELLPPLNANAAASEHVLRSMKRIYDLGIRPEWWRVAPLAAPGWAEVDALIAERDPYCRGVLLSGPPMRREELAAAFAAAAQHRSCRGFTTGPEVFVEPARAWLRNEIDDTTLVASVSVRLAEVAGLWRKTRSFNTSAQDMGEGVVA